MTSAERIAAAFTGIETDKIPIHHIGISSQVASALLGREAYVGGGIQQWREARALWEGPSAHQEFIERSYEDALAISKLLGNDLLRVSYWRWSSKPTKVIDEYTLLFEGAGDQGTLVMRYNPTTEICNIEPVHPQPEQTLAELEDSLTKAESEIEEYQPKVPVLEGRAKSELGSQYVFRYEAANLTVGYDAIWLEALALRPDLVVRSLDLQVERARREVPVAAECGFKYLFGGGDMASDHGPFYSPTTFHSLVLPRLQEIAKICHTYDCYFLFASDGNLWPVAEDLFGNSGVDGYYEIDKRAGMDLKQLHDRFPHLTTIGNISSQTLHQGTPGDVREEVEHVMNEAKRFGRTIVGISNQLVIGTPIANVEIMLETIGQLR